MRTWKHLKDGMEHPSRSHESDVGPIRSVFENIRLFRDLASDYRRGVYPNAPWWAVCALGFALAYAIWPIDLIHDMIPVAGYADDSLVVLLCLKLIQQQIADYRTWRAGTGQ